MSSVKPSPDPFLRVHSLIRRKRRVEALRVLLSEDGRVRRQFDSDRNHAWYLVGDILFHQGNLDEAAVAFRKAIKEWPQDVDARMALANCMSELGRHRWAVFHLRKAISSASDVPALRYNLGNAYFDLGQYGAAIREYKRAEALGATGIAR